MSIVIPLCAPNRLSGFYLYISHQICVYFFFLYSCDVSVRDFIALSTRGEKYKFWITSVLFYLQMFSVAHKFEWNHAHSVDLTLRYYWCVHPVTSDVRPVGVNYCRKPESVKVACSVIAMIFQRNLTEIHHFKFRRFNGSDLSYCSLLDCDTV